MPSSRTIVLGTHNRKKGLELQTLLEPYGFSVQTLADFPEALHVEETGTTFAENARLKACQQARHLGFWTIGEDSGLMVEALDGAPGVYSARFSGADATDEKNNAHLLEQLRDVPLARRAARYVCHICVANQHGEVQFDVEAACRGRIALRPAGNAGFGYDPLFEIVEYHRTFGQLGDAVKQLLSHRGRAVRQLVPALLRQTIRECGTERNTRA